MSGWSRVAVLSLLLALTVGLVLAPRSLQGRNAAAIDGKGFVKKLADAERIDGLNAEEWLEKFRAIYQSLTTYRDRGRGYLVDQPSGNRVRVISSHAFQTAFDRNGGFRFVQDSETGGFHQTAKAIWQKPGEIEASSWWSIGGKTEKGELDHHLSAAVGISQGASKLVYGTAQPPRPGRRKLENARIVGTGTIDGRDCVIIEGRNQSARSTLWIDRETHVLRRVETLFDGSDSASVLILQPEIDPKLNADDFDYTPPK